jgi:predicted transcriptional regulator
MMAGRLSSSKVSRIFQLHFQGYSQCSIASWLHIHQSTVSIYVNRFTTLAEGEGLETAARRYGVMQEVIELRNLAAELKKSRLTVAESRTGLRVQDMLKSHGVAEDAFGDLIESAKKMKSEGFIEAAMELSRLERDSGLNYQQVCTSYQSRYKQLQQADNDLAGKKSELERSGSAFVAAETQRKAAESRFESYLKETEMDMKRLQKVEPLARALKKSGIQDSQLDDYLERQQLLDRSGISLDLLSSILKQTNVVTAHDGGKTFLDMLTRYGGLDAAMEVLQDRIKALEKNAEGLDQKIQIKNSTEADIVQLKKQKVNLEKEVAQLSAEKEDLTLQRTALQKDMRSLNQQKAALEQDISGQQKLWQSLCIENESLSGEIKTKRDQLSDMEQLQARRSSVLANIAEIEDKLAQRRKQQDVLDSFIDLIDHPSFEELERFAGFVPHLINKAKQQKEPPQSLTDYVFGKITAGKLKPQKCNSCYATFATDRLPMKSLGYHCPVCSSTLVREAYTEASIMLKEALAQPKVWKIVRTTETQKPVQNDKPST